MYGRLWVSIDLMPLIFSQAIITPFCPYIYHLSFPSTHLGLSGVTLLFLTEHLFPPWFPFTPSVSGLERADVPNSISISTCSKCCHVTVKLAQMKTETITLPAVTLLLPLVHINLRFSPSLAVSLTPSRLCYGISLLHQKILLRPFCKQLCFPTGNTRRTCILCLPETDSALPRSGKMKETHFPIKITGQFVTMHIPCTTKASVRQF